MEILIAPADIDKLDMLINFILNGAKKLGFDEAALSHLRLASEEALVNIINYAYPKKEGDIEIKYEIKNTQLNIEISDSGIPFDPLKIPEPDITLPLDKRPIGGLGLFMMKKIMDEITYKRKNNRNVLTMVKRKQ